MKRRTVINKWIVVVVLLVMAITTYAMAGDTLSEEKNGWFWYKYQPPTKDEDDPENPSRKGEKPKDEIFIPKLYDYTYESLMSMHPDELRPLLESFHKKMVQSPTLDNATEYQIIKEVARKKARAAATAMTMVTQINPSLGAERDYPTSNAGRVAFQSQQRSEVESRLADARESFGLLYFYRDDCPYCDAMNKSLQLFLTKYGWEVKYVDTKFQKPVADMFSADSVPYVITVYRKTGESMPVTAGVIPLTEFEDRLYRAIRYLRKETPLENLDTYDFQKGGAFDLSAPISFPARVKAEGE